LLNLLFFASPYFDHDAFMHHALHVLDAIEDLICDTWVSATIFLQHNISDQCDWNIIVDNSTAVA